MTFSAHFVAAASGVILVVLFEGSAVFSGTNHWHLCLETHPQLPTLGRDKLHTVLIKEDLVMLKGH